MNTADFILLGSVVIALSIAIPVSFSNYKTLKKIKKK